MSELLDGMIEFSGLHKNDIEPIENLFELHVVPAKFELISANQYCQRVWFVSSGLLRSYCRIEELKRKNCENQTTTREVTTWIASAGSFLTDFYSFLHQKATLYNIEALQPSRIYSLSYKNYLILQRTHPDISKSIFEQTLVDADRRIRMMSLRNPTDRLSHFETIFPDMRGMISVNVLASYLNIEPATLSRIRANRR